VVFLATIGCGLLTFRLVLESGRVGRLEAMLVAMVSVLFPAFQVWMLLATANYVLSYALFLGAVLLGLRAEGSSGGRRLTAHVCSLVLFFFSFGMNSLLVFYFGFLLLLFLKLRRAGQLTRGRALRTAVARSHYLLLPFVFWVVKQVFFPRHGLYTSYNKFTLSLDTLNYNLHLFLTNGLVAQLRDAFALLTAQPALCLALLLLVAWLFMSASWSRGSRARLERALAPGEGLRETGTTYGVMLFGLILLFLAVFPYVAVGLGPKEHGWDTRHALLLGLPVGVITVGFVRLLVGKKSPPGRLPRAALAACVLLVLALGCATAGGYVGWQARWAKDRSVLKKLSSMGDLRTTSTFFVSDYSRMGTQEGYQFYELSYMFNSIWGGQCRIGLDERLNNHQYWTPRLMKLRKYFNPRYGLANYDPTGPQTYLVIRRGPRQDKTGDLEVAARYLLYRYVLPDRLGPFLDELTDVQSEPAFVEEEKG
jgi:hypothetical protein